MNMEETPYRLICPEHGGIFLTEAQYYEQLLNADERWKCPTCDSICEFDDDHFEKSLEE